MLDSEQEDSSSSKANDHLDNNVVIKQINELKKRIDQLTNEVKHHEANKIKLEEEISKLREQLNEYIVNNKNNKKEETEENEDDDTEKSSNLKKGSSSTSIEKVI